MGEPTTEEGKARRREMKRVSNARRYAAKRGAILAANAVWQKKNAEKVRAYQTEYRIGERAKERAAARRAANPTPNRERAVRWAAEHPDEVREGKAAYYRANAEKIKARSSAWSAANRERATARTAEWRARNPEKFRAIKQRRRSRKRGAETEKFTDLEIFERDGWTCGICRESIDPSLRHGDPMAVQLDHVIPLGKGGSHTRANVQASHASCNRHKGARLIRVA